MVYNECGVQGYQESDLRLLNVHVSCDRNERTVLPSIVIDDAISGRAISTLKIQKYRECVHNDHVKGMI